MGKKLFENIILNILIIHVLFDILAYWTPSRGWFGMVRGAFFIYLFLYYLIKYKYPKNWGSTVIIIFSIYSILLIPFATNIIESSRITLQVLSSILLYPIAYSIVKTERDMFVVTRSIFIVIILLVVNFTISNIWKLGNYSYSSDSAKLYLGNYADAVNIFVYCLFVLPLILMFFGSKKIIISALAIFLLVVIALSTKRIAAITTIFGVLLYVYINRAMLKSVLSRIIIVSILFLIISPIFLSSVIDRWTVRDEAGRLESDAYKSEGRYFETLAVWDEILSFSSFSKSFFGLEAFNSPGLYAGGRFGGRQIHVDYNLIVHTTGLLGLFFYLYMYYSIFRNYKYYIRKPSFINIDLKVYHSVFLLLYFGSLITSLAGQMYNISFRSLIFLLLGAITGYLKSTHKKLSINENFSSL